MGNYLLPQKRGKLPSCEEFILTGSPYLIEASQLRLIYRGKKYTFLKQIGVNIVKTRGAYLSPCGFFAFQNLII